LFFDQVPQQYKLLGYRSFDVQEASSNYVPECLAKTLRTGAEVGGLEGQIKINFNLIKHKFSQD